MYNELSHQTELVTVFKCYLFIPKPNYHVSVILIIEHEDWNCMVPTHKQCPLELFKMPKRTSPVMGLFLTKLVGYYELPMV